MKIHIEEDYVMIALTPAGLKVTAYSSEDVKFELEDVFYHPSGFKFVISKRSEIEESAKRLVQPLIDKIEKQIKPLNAELDLLKDLLK